MNHGEAFHQYLDTTLFAEDAGTTFNGFPLCCNHFVQLTSTFGIGTLQDSLEICKGIFWWCT